MATVAKRRLKNNRLLKAIRRQPLDRTPIWIMRQAGRYLPEYLAVRAKAGSFMNLCKTPALACEVSLQPVKRYPLDAAIIFSDILTIPDAMGLGLHFVEGQGPIFAYPIRTKDAVDKLKVPDPLSDLSYVLEAIRLVKAALNRQIPLIGFCGSPWTLAAYMIEGESVPGFPRTQCFLTREPDLLHRLLTILAESVQKHLQAQILAGADVVMIFDSWGGLLTQETYKDFSLAYIAEIIRGLKQDVRFKDIPVILFTKGGSRFLEDMADSGCDVIGLDWEISLKEARCRVFDRVALQGNMHPSCLLQSKELIWAETKTVLDSYGKGSGHIFNLGHGITPDVPPEHVATLIEAVHTLSPAYYS